MAVRKPSGWVWAVPPGILLVGIVLVGALAVSQMGPEDVPIWGPCGVTKRVAPEKDYYWLALTLETRAAGSFKDRLYPRDEAERRAWLEGHARLREKWLPTLADPCLRAYGAMWLSVRERATRTEPLEGKMLNVRWTDGDRRARALADKLGVALP